MKSSEILELLKLKHSDDVFVPECKDGPTWDRNHLRLDAWVMNKSWAHFRMTGYEIKVSRSDFLNDKKYMSYLPLCNVLYVVTAPGVVKSADEIAEGVGWICVSSTGKRLITKKQAMFREIDPPMGLMSYILICRAHIDHEDTHQQSNIDYWKEWLKTKNMEALFGNRISRTLAQELDIYRYKLKEENEALKRENEFLKDVKNQLEAMGINGKDKWQIRRQLEDYKDGHFKEVKNIVTTLNTDIERAGRQLRNVLDRLEKPFQE